MGSSRNSPSRFRFTKTKLDQLTKPEAGRCYHYDTAKPGLAVCVTSAGAKTFYFYRKIDGRPVRVRIGRFPDLSVEAARKLADKLAVKVAAGEDPQATKRERRGEPTLADLFVVWMDYARAHKKTWEGDQAQYDRYLKPWANRRLSAVKKTEVQALHVRLGRDSGHYAANRALALLRAMFNRAADVGWQGPNPCHGVKAFKEQSRDRFLKPDELPRFFQALEEEPSPILRGFFLTCLLTGARRSNVLTMRWDDLDFASAVWRIPDTKRGEPQLVPLCPPAMAILIALRPLAKDGWVFPSTRRTKAGGHLTDPMPSWRRILKRAGLKDLRIHDLRRSLGSWQALGGASLQVIGATLGHSRPETTAIYSRLTLDPVRAAVNQATAAMLEAGGVLQVEGPRDED
ncbi:MAG TPA: tyrosine-type recombinase/integrase [Thermoguttaceae bacterium]|nr:tyrosine-type recombinase/integrase [Thermoguttaceae bacterium]